MCPGRHFATSALFLVVASILSTFDLVKAKDEDGNEIEVDGEYVDAGIWYVFNASLLHFGSRR